MNIYQGVCACAPLRISSSTARTLAIPARQIAVLSARISLSICYAPRRLALANKIIRVNYTSDAVLVPALGVLSHDATLALHDYILVAAGQLRRKRDFKFHIRANLKRR